MAFKILIAEDEEITLKHLISTLIGEGYEVVGEKDGRAAYDRINSDHFDLLITDMKMPVMGGLELMDKVKEMHPEY